MASQWTAAETSTSLAIRTLQTFLLKCISVSAPSYNTGGNGFVTKINPAVPSYVFSTYLGGSAMDEANSIAIDPAANVYVTGNTISTDFPIANAFQATIGDTSFPTPSSQNSRATDH